MYWKNHDAPRHFVRVITLRQLERVGFTCFMDSIECGKVQGDTKVVGKKTFDNSSVHVKLRANEHTTLDTEKSMQVKPRGKQRLA